MDLDAFLLENQATWDRLAVLVRRARRGVHQLSVAEADEMLALYQRTSGNLSYARTYLRHPGLVLRLSDLVGRASAAIYGTRSRSLRGFVRFFTMSMPAALWHVRRTIAVCALLFIGVAASSGIWIANDAETQSVVIDREAREALIATDFEDYYSSEAAAAFAGHVFLNNVMVGFWAFGAGAVGGFATFLVLINEGLRFGAMAGVFASAGQAGKFFGLVLPHGLLELTAVWVAAAAGLRLPWALIDPGDRPRATALVEEGRRTIVVVCAVVFALAIAGMIEGFITGHVASAFVRVGIGVVAECAAIAYVVVWGRRAAGMGLTGMVGETDDLGWIRRPKVAARVAAPAATA